MLLLGLGGMGGGILEILACLPFVSLGVGGLFDEKGFNCTLISSLLLIDPLLFLPLH